MAVITFIGFPFQHLILVGISEKYLGTLFTQKTVTNWWSGLLHSFFQELGNHVVGDVSVTGST